MKGQNAVANSDTKKFTLATANEDYDLMKNNYRCPKYAFQCAYGACVDGSAECNSKKDCVDNSDELTIKCPGVLEYLKDRGNCS